MAARRDRVFAVPADDRTAVWYSKPLAEGVGIEFTDGYYVRSETGGDVTGLAVLDDKVLVFKKNQIRYFGGAHVSFAVALPDGLITPVIRDSHEKSVFQISTEAKALGKLAKDKKLKPDHDTGGIISNMRRL